MPTTTSTTMVRVHALRPKGSLVSTKSRKSAASRISFAVQPARLLGLLPSTAGFLMQTSRAPG